MDPVPAILSICYGF